MHGVTAAGPPGADWVLTGPTVGGHPFFALGPSVGTEVLVTAAAVGATALAGLRWLRVAQREHYLVDSCSRFATRWWLAPPNVVLAIVALAGLGLAGRWPVAGLSTAVVVAGGPLGLGIRGRSSPLAWTRRLRTLAVVWAACQVLVIGVGAAVGSACVAALAGAAGVPCIVDLACLLTAPWERRGAQRFVASAARRLAEVAPRVVAVTGSYGKTSTKSHILHLVSGSRAVVASPASYNNRAGLSKAVNEHLADGTEVFVAEMGTYGPGEIAQLCAWCPPEIAVITAIGPVHLERFGSEDRIVAAKAEIAERAAHVVVNVDDDRLRALADRLAGEGKDVRRCSAEDGKADVLVHPDGEGGLDVTVEGVEVARGLPARPGCRPGNLACALAVALLLDVAAEDAVTRIATLPEVPNRLSTTVSAKGFAIIDDTYNANPAGTRAALAALDAAGAARSGRRVVVTPGMVELGARQREENRSFAREAAGVATDLVVVGRTNRRALLAGAAEGSRARGRGRGVETVCVPRREAAVEWAREHLGPDDVVLYENDLPDQYP